MGNLQKIQANLSYRKNELAELEAYRLRLLSEYNDVDAKYILNKRNKELATYRKELQYDLKCVNGRINTKINQIVKLEKDIMTNTGGY